MRESLLTFGANRGPPIRPKHVILFGDLNKIGAEPMSKLLGDSITWQEADLVFVSDDTALEQNMHVAGTRFPFNLARRVDDIDRTSPTPTVLSFQPEGDLATNLVDRASAADNEALHCHGLVVDIAPAGARLTGSSWRPSISRPCMRAG